MNIMSLAALVFLLGAAPALNDKDDTMTLMDFSPADTAAWRVVNDDVMGGLSRSYLRRTDQQTAMFGGSVSLENNGGFASVRRPLAAGDLSPYTGLTLRVRGDGRSYQLRLRTDRGFSGVAYRAAFGTVAGEWITVHLPFDGFEPVWRGRVLADEPPLDLASVRQIGFLIADKKAGAFALEIDTVDVVRAGEASQ